MTGPAFQRGDFVTLNMRVGVVVRCGKDLPDGLEDHTGVWFGTSEQGVPEVWTIPTEYLQAGPAPEFKH